MTEEGLGQGMLPAHRPRMSVPTADRQETSAAPHRSEVMDTWNWMTPSDRYSRRSCSTTSSNMPLCQRMRRVIRPMTQGRRGQVCTRCGAGLAHRAAGGHLEGHGHRAHVPAQQPEQQQGQQDQQRRHGRQKGAARPEGQSGRHDQNGGIERPAVYAGGHLGTAGGGTWRSTSVSRSWLVTPSTPGLGPQHQTVGAHVAEYGLARPRAPHSPAAPAGRGPGTCAPERPRPGG